MIFKITPATFFYTTQEYALSQYESGDDSLFTKIDIAIDEELRRLGIDLKARIRA